MIKVIKNLDSHHFCFWFVFISLWIFHWAKDYSIFWVKWMMFSWTVTLVLLLTHNGIVKNPTNIHKFLNDMDYSTAHVIPYFIIIASIIYGIFYRSPVTIAQITKTSAVGPRENRGFK